MEKDKELFCKEKTSFKGVILVCRQCGSVKDDFDKSNFCNSCGCGIFISKEEYTKEKLIKFEEEIRDLFLDKKILAPVHLTKGNEEQLIEIFKDIKKDDWVFSTHRSHYHALLKEIDREWLKNEILERRSISIHNKEHKFFSSAIVAGVIPIAVGVALGIKRQGKKDTVWVFIGDMATEMGMAYECMKYAGGFNLPIVFVVEDNGLSVDTPTQKVWGETGKKAQIIRYEYERGYPHQGCGTWVVF